MLQAKGLTNAAMAASYMPLRLLPAGMAPLLMASFAFFCIPSLVAVFHAPAAAARTLKPKR